MLSLVLAAALAASVPAVPASGPLPLDAFFEKPAISGPALSPSGRYLATIERRGEGQAVVVTDRQTGERRMITRSSTESAGFDWVEWKSDDRLLMKVWLYKIRRANGRAKGPILGVTWGNYLEACDRDGKNLVVMFQDSPGRVQRSAARVRFLNELKGDPTHALVGAPDGRGAYSVWKVDLTSGGAELAAVGDWNTTGWGVDANGQVILRASYRDRSVVFEAPDGARWAEITRIRRKDIKAPQDFEIMGPGPRSGQLYVAVKPERAGEADGRELRLFDLRTQSLSEPQWPASKYDVENIVYKPGGSELAGVCYLADVYGCQFKDKDQQARFDRLTQTFKGDRNIVQISASDDDSLRVVSVGGPNAPGSYYLYDVTKKGLELLGDRFPALPPERLGAMERYAYKARDGVEIPAYLTRPPGAAKAPLPLVVMPHGGPETRDSYAYDGLAQFLTTRGYLVLQPNFRGSGGLGAGFAQAGYRQWGARMQDDITDGVKALIASGQADPARICIVGASYGGYAALYGGASTPELYKCVVSEAGVADLNALLKWEKKAGADSPSYRYWVKSIGDPSQDSDRLRKVSPITYAADYRPPVLLIHGELDDTVPLEQSKMMQSALKQAGRDVKLVVYQGEGHGGFDEEHEKDSYRQIAGFLKEHIGAGTP